MDAEGAESAEADARFEAEDWRREPLNRTAAAREANRSDGSDGVFCRPLCDIAGQLAQF